MTSTTTSATDKDFGLQAISGLLFRYRTSLTRIIAVTGFLALWEWAARSGSIDPLFLSSPILVARELVKVFAAGSIWPHIGASGQVAILGFAATVLIGVPIGILMGRVRLVRDTLEPFVMAKYSAPTVAFLPLLILWLGLGLAS